MGVALCWVVIRRETSLLEYSLVRETMSRGSSDCMFDGKRWNGVFTLSERWQLKPADLDSISSSCWLFHFALPSTMYNLVVWKIRESGLVATVCTCTQFPDISASDSLCYEDISYTCDVKIILHQYILELQVMGTGIRRSEWKARRAVLMSLTIQYKIYTRHTSWPPDIGLIWHTHV